MRLIFEPTFSGTQNLGAVGLHVDSVEGFDIAPHADEAFLVGTLLGVQKLYAVDLTAPSLTAVGPIGGGGSPIRSLALHARPSLVWAVASVPQSPFPATTVLVSFLSSRPGTLLSYVPLRGQGLEQIIGVDVRPATGELYALTKESRLYTVDTVSGQLTPVNTTPLPVSYSAFGGVGLDFDPVTDTLRIVDAWRRNVVINPDTATVVFAANNLDTSTDRLAGLAYDFPADGTSARTAFALNVTRSLFGTVGGPGGVPPANTGEIFLRGPLACSLNTDAVGFDIAAADRVGLMAVGAVGNGSTTLCTVNLTTGRARSAGTIAAIGADLRGLAIAAGGTGSSSRPPH